MVKPYYVNEYSDIVDELFTEEDIIELEMALTEDDFDEYLMGNMDIQSYEDLPNVQRYFFALFSSDDIRLQIIHQDFYDYEDLKRIYTHDPNFIIRVFAFTRYKERMESSFTDEDYELLNLTAEEVRLFNLHDQDRYEAVDLINNEEILYKYILDADRLGTVEMLFQPVGVVDAIVKIQDEEILYSVFNGITTIEWQQETLDGIENLDYILQILAEWYEHPSFLEVVLEKLNEFSREEMQEFIDREEIKLLHELLIDDYYDINHPKIAEVLGTNGIIDPEFVCENIEVFAKLSLFDVLRYVDYIIDKSIVQQILDAVEESEIIDMETTSKILIFADQMEQRFSEEEE